jgi:hypothetical protein
MDHRNRAEKTYEPPAITVLGTVHSLTLTDWSDKKFGWSDGYLFLDDRVTNSSR